MKIFLKGILILGLLTGIQPVFSQTICDGDRYLNGSYFSNVTTAMNVTYGSNSGVGTGTAQSLEMDIYQPQVDTLSKRPLIIFAHGGSFIGGSKSEAASLCNTFAKMGYVTATIEYRVGFFFPVNEASTTLAVMRGMHDMKAAIRFFRKDAANSNTYKIDPDKIIIGGISAGAIAAIHAAYLDELSEIPAYLVNDTAGLGGIEGNSGNPGYSSEALAVINFAGAIGDTSWINHGDAVMISFHYSGDQTVPYDTREVSVSGIPTGLIASGSGTIKTRMDNIGVVNALNTFSGSGHVDYLSGSSYNTVIDSAKIFLYDNATCKQSTTSITENQFALNRVVQIYPNPSNGNFELKWNELNKEKTDIAVYNSLGQLMVKLTDVAGTETSLNISQLNKGLYFLALTLKKRGKLWFEENYCGVIDGPVVQWIERLPDGRQGSFPKL